MSDDLNVQRSLGRLESKVDLIIEKQTEIAQKLEKQNDRIAIVEGGLSTTRSLGSAMAFLVTIVATVLPTIWHRS